MESARRTLVEQVRDGHTVECNVNMAFRGERYCDCGMDEALDQIEHQLGQLGELAHEKQFRAAIAKALDVPDGGQYLNDSLQRIESLEKGIEAANSSIVYWQARESLAKSTLDAIYILLGAKDKETGWEAIRHLKEDKEGAEALARDAIGAIDDYQADLKDATEEIKRLEEFIARYGGVAGNKVANLENENMQLREAINPGGAMFEAMVSIMHERDALQAKLEEAETYKDGIIESYDGTVRQLRKDLDEARAHADMLVSETQCSDAKLEFTDNDNGPGEWSCVRCGASVESKTWVADESGRRVPPLPLNFPHQEVE